MNSLDPLIALPIFAASSTSRSGVALPVSTSGIEQPQFSGVAIDSDDLFGVEPESGSQSPVASMQMLPSPRPSASHSPPVHSSRITVSGVSHISVPGVTATPLASRNLPKIHSRHAHSKNADVGIRAPAIVATGSVESFQITFRLDKSYNAPADNRIKKRSGRPKGRPKRRSVKEQEQKPHLGRLKKNSSVIVDCPNSSYGPANGSNVESTLRKNHLEAIDNQPAAGFASNTAPQANWGTEQRQFGHLDPSLATQGNWGTEQWQFGHLDPSLANYMGHVPLPNVPQPPPPGTLHDLSNILPGNQATVPLQAHYNGRSPLGTVAHPDGNYDTFVWLN